MKRVLKRILIIVAALAAAGVAAYAAIDAVILENVLVVGEATLERLALVAINSAIKETVASSEEYGELVDIRTDAEGNITLVRADTLRINEIANRAALTAQRNFGEIDYQYISIPLGNALGGQLLSGQGPPIRIRIEPVGSFSTGFYTEFEAAGINQTRHKIFIVINARLRMIVGAKNKSVSVTGEMLISETIIIGAVPESFVNVESTDDLLNLLP